MANGGSPNLPPDITDEGCPSENFITREFDIDDGGKIIVSISNTQDKPLEQEISGIIIGILVTSLWGKSNHDDAVEAVIGFLRTVEVKSQAEGWKIRAVYC